MKKGIAFFDFDGTITTRDSLLEFIKFAKGAPAFYTGFLYNIFYLLAYKIKLISNQAAKEKVLSYFFKGEKLVEFNKLATNFSETLIPSLLRPKAQEEICRLQKKDFVIVIVSASPENWLTQWCQKNNLELIASRLEVKEDKITGRLIGKNCHGEEKVRRILEKYTLNDYDEILAYGDSSGDRPMLNLAKKCFFKPFHNKVMIS